MSTQDRVRTFIIDELRFRGSAKDLKNDLPLLEKEILDSMGIFQVVSFLEAEYGIEIDDEDLIADNFGTIDGIARLVESKQGS
ncbi:MAG TPA: acyl carrier protein [Acidimicrobiia bacterium]|nr:acyl carrier protein [Acidimicrobiia bacterium]